MNILKKKTLIAYVFPILQTKKEVVRQISKKLFLKRPFNKWHGKQAETLLKSPRHDLYHIYWSLWRQLSWKKSLLSICKILELFLNTLTADDKYSLLNKGKLTQSIHMHLSKKKKTFFQFVFPYLEFGLKFQHLEIKVDPHGICLCEITDSERRD